MLVEIAWPRDERGHRVAVLILDLDGDDLAGIGAPPGSIILVAVLDLAGREGLAEKSRLDLAEVVAAALHGHELVVGLGVGDGEAEEGVELVGVGAMQQAPQGEEEGDAAGRRRRAPGQPVGGRLVEVALGQERPPPEQGEDADKNQQQDPDSGEKLHGAILRPLPNEPVTLA